MKLQRGLAPSILLVVLLEVNLAVGLTCHCTGSHHPQCLHMATISCGEGYQCAIMYRNDVESTYNMPNPRAACSIDFVEELGPGVCQGAFNNASLFIACCNNEDLCNDKVVPEYATTTVTEVDMATTTSASTRDFGRSSDVPGGGPGSSGEGNWSVYLGLIVVIPLLVVSVVLLFLLFTYVYYCRLKAQVRRHSKCHEWDMKNPAPPSLTTDVDFKSTVPSTLEGTCTCTSGSGAGLPLLTQRTIARSIKLGERIGSGRFGQVFVGDYMGEKLAVKKFVSHDDKSWARETEIYNTVFLVNENILGFFASDMVSNNGVTELWLITHYHPNGSLYDYLNQESLTPDVTVLMINSCCRGVSHLHTELPGTCGKPAIAHRDIKSKNILVKNNLECCVADFGLAVIRGSNGLSLPTNPRQGTKRYMPPEILDGSINMERFESFKQADVYSLGLVLWEICRRCALKDGITLDYELPFQGLVPADPSFEDMRKLVIDKRKTPAIPDEWQKDELLKRLARMMQECWHFQGAARPTAANLMKRMAKLLERTDSPHTLE